LHVVEDDDIQRDVFARITASEAYNTLVHSDAASFLNCVEPDCFGVVLLDIELPDISGLQVLEELAIRKIKMPVIILSAHATFDLCRQAFRGGAADFLKKDADPMYVKHTVLKHIKKETERYRTWLEDNATRQKLETLTNRERDVLRLLLMGMSSKQVALELNISPRTAEVHRSNIMRKLNVKSFNKIFYELSGFQNYVISSSSAGVR
jgi:FixJ family two-component response regulator